MRYGFNSRHVNSIISGIFTALSQNSISKDNEQKLSSIEELFDKIIKCTTKNEIESILGDANIGGGVIYPNRTIYSKQFNKSHKIW